MNATTNVNGGLADRTIRIAIASGKGGVGKSTITANLAVALSRMGMKVGIADCDVYGFSIPELLGVQQGRMLIVDGRMLPADAHGVQVASMGFLAPPDQPVIWRGPMLAKALQAFLKDVDWGDLDVLLLDLPPGTGDVALDVHRFLPQLSEIIVTTPHPLAASVAIRAGKMALDHGHQVLGVIENMAYLRTPAGSTEHLFGQGGGDTLAASLGVPLLARVPIKEYASEDGVLFSEDSEAGKVISELARELMLQHSDHVSTK